jgi:membrane-bound serine protease (ClpP class)
MSKFLTFAFLSIAGLLFLSNPLFADYSEPGLDKGLAKTNSELLSIDTTIPAKPRVHYLSVEGAVTPVMAEFIVKSIEEATKDNAEFVVIELDTPGGLDLSMRIIVKAILASEVPVVLYVGPAGARAASAGVFISYAAHVAAMTPGTNIGSAHPVAMGGEKMDETMVAKVENDAAAYIMGLAAKRGRNVEWAEKAVRESVNITAEEALKLGVIEILALNRDELFLELHGRTVETIAGDRTLRAEGVEVKEVSMNLRSQILNAISDPNVAYILMMIGMMGLYFELSNPGAIFPGVVGTICLILAFYSFQTLPVNYAGLLLIGLAVVFFVAEIQVASFGFLSMAGVISLFLGSLMLFDSPAPFLRVSLWIIMPTVIVVSAFFMTVMYLVLKTYRRRPVSGLDALTVDVGVASEDFGLGGREGQIFIEGEYWRALSDEPIKEGEHVKVTEIDGLILTVSKVQGTEVN